MQVKCAKIILEPYLWVAILVSNCVIACVNDDFT